MARLADVAERIVLGIVVLNVAAIEARRVDVAVFGTSVLALLFIVWTLRARRHPRGPRH